jgi:hypothetical protein
MGATGPENQGGVTARGSIPPPSAILFGSVGEWFKPARC